MTYDPPCATCGRRMSEHCLFKPANVPAGCQLDSGIHVTAFPMTEQEIRQAFEDWFLAKYPSSNLSRDCLGYIREPSEMAHSLPLFRS